MPMYEYECKQCHQRMEKIQHYDDPEETVCVQCGGPLERLVSAPSLQFKGAGWHVNDYAKSAASAPTSCETGCCGTSCCPMTSSSN